MHCPRIACPEWWGHGESEPRSVGALARRSRHVCDAAKNQNLPNNNSAQGIAAEDQMPALRSPTSTLCPAARGLSSQHGGWERTSPHVRCEVVLPLPPARSKLLMPNEVQDDPTHPIRNSPIVFERGVVTTQKHNNSSLMHLDTSSKLQL